MAEEKSENANQNFRNYGNLYFKTKIVVHYRNAQRFGSV